MIRVGLAGSMRAVAVAVLLLSVASVSPGYSVLTHEAIIDSTWETGIKPLLIKRFASASADELRKARAYAYGGSIIQDMGYYPLGSKFFSDLTHYVRSGRFVETLISDSQDIYEYAFALGALCHYVSDTNGHPIAVNPSVPILYPKLRGQYGNSVTYEDNPAAHIQTEFGFDVVQVALGRYAPEDYHDFVGFEVSKPLLERAFKKTYGIELKSIFTSLDLALGTYRYSVSRIIPTMTVVAWESKKEEIAKQSPGITREKFIYRLSLAGYRKEWGNQYEKPGPGTTLLADLFRILPKIGPFKALAFKPATPETEKLFIKSVESTVDRYRQLLAGLKADHLELRDTDFDTGRPTHLGEYRLADRAYAKLLDSLASNSFESVSPDLRENILAFFGNEDSSITVRKDIQDWRKTLGELNKLKATQPRRGAVLPDRPCRPCPDQRPDRSGGKGSA
jgi:hypothetical protein